MRNPPAIRPGDNYFQNSFSIVTLDLTSALFAVLDLADDRRRVDALAAVVVRDRGLDRLLREHRAVHLHGRQAVERFHDRLVRQLERVFDLLALDEVGRHAARRDGRAAAEGHELDVHDRVVFHLDVHAHDVAALRVADFADAVRVLDFTDIVRVCEMFHYFFTVCHNQSDPFQNKILYFIQRCGRG